MGSVRLVAPIKGWVAPLDEVPDPVFAERLLGDGVAIDPTDSTMCAPCAGVITMAAGHAVSIRAENGAEILIHVGLETVALSGQGFIVHVREGAYVRTGDPLITLDLDFLAERARSLLSPIVLTNGDSFRISGRITDREAAAGQFLMEIEAVATAHPHACAPLRAEGEVVIGLAHGLHARPAALLARSARSFQSRITMLAGSQRADLASVAALMTLGTKRGERVRILAEGADAQAAVAQICAVLAEGLGEGTALPSPPRVPATDRPRADPREGLTGVCAVPGLAVGRVVWLRRDQVEVTETGGGEELELGRLEAALAEVGRMIADAAEEARGARREILCAHQELLRDPQLWQGAVLLIAGGKSAGYAWRQAIGTVVQVLSGLDDPRMRERVQDLRDLESQVLTVLAGAAKRDGVPLPEHAIVLADDLLPSELLRLDRAQLAGIALGGGGATSHVAILAAGMAVPLLVGLGPALAQLDTGCGVILDAGAGRLRLEPDEVAFGHAIAAAEQRARKALELRSEALRLCHMADGTRIEVFANLGAGEDEARAAIAHGAEGCGLLRTEFLFLGRADPPGFEEQRALYQAIGTALDGRPLIVRSFDIGADKPAPYLPVDTEDNPALGLRGIRLALRHPDLLRTQIAALIAVRPEGSIRLMLPMVVSVGELLSVRTILRQCEAEAGIKAPTALGVMIETPAAAVLAAQLAEVAEFFSIGTNDLTQYALAMDRTNAALTAEADGLHPAVLHLIAAAVKGARSRSRPIGVCGALAADPDAVPILIGLGVEELSVPLVAIPAIKARLRSLDSASCRELARQALACDSARAVRELGLEQGMPA